MRDAFNKLGANVKFESRSTYGHMWPVEFPALVGDHLYPNIKGSGFGKSNPYNMEDDMDWATDGYWGKFDQSLYTDGNAPKDWHLRKYGFFYYPKNCIKGGCNF